MWSSSFFPARSFGGDHSLPLVLPPLRYVTRPRFTFKVFGKSRRPEDKFVVGGSYNPENNQVRVRLSTKWCGSSVASLPPSSPPPPPPPRLSPPPSLLFPHATSTGRARVGQRVRIADHLSPQDGLPPKAGSERTRRDAAAVWFRGLTRRSARHGQEKRGGGPTDATDRSFG